MKYLLILCLFCYSIQAMEIDDTKDIEIEKVEFNPSRRASELKDPTPIGSVPKVPSENTQKAQQDRRETERPKPIVMISKEEQVLDKCCPSCWSKDTQCCGNICLDGVKKSCLCYVAAGPVEELIRLFCCECFFDWCLKENDIKEGKQEEE